MSLMAHKKIHLRHLYARLHYFRSKDMLLIANALKENFVVPRDRNTFHVYWSNKLLSTSTSFFERQRKYHEVVGLSHSISDAWVTGGVTFSVQTSEHAGFVQSPYTQSNTYIFNVDSNVYKKPGPGKLHASMERDIN